LAASAAVAAVLVVPDEAPARVVAVPVAQAVRVARRVVLAVLPVAELASVAEQVLLLRLRVVNFTVPRDTNKNVSF
jgi:hypothetical protein